MNKPFIEIDAEHFTLSAFETKPIEGYEAPTNKETGEQFPNCCPFHKSVFEGAESWFSKFPNCCDQHKAMVSKWWYNKANYSGIAEKIVKQLSYTEHHISERINIDDWYKDITDYIEYNVSSFGHPAIGLHLYLGNVQHYIKNTNSEIPKNKRQRLIEFIETYYNSPKEQTKTDLNILYSTYQKWLKVFPFEISFFSTLKPHFEKQLPILNGKPETNKYTGLAKVKMHTKGSLIDVLLNLTNNLITQINTTTLYEKGLLTEPQKIKLELVLNERKMKLKQGYVNSSKDEEQRYRKILKEWFADEKRFIDEVTPIVKALPPQPIVESPFSVLEWATIFYYADETKLLTESRLIKTRLEQFMNKHQINTTFDNFKTKYYEAKKRINEKNDYPINKLELIIPFLKENYKQTVTKVENDIIFLEENKPEY
jgi:hypothetical protein